MTQHDQWPRIGVVVVAFNASSTLARTLDRIPRDFRARLAEVIILDDASLDDTFALARLWGGHAGAPSTVVVRHTKNLGYGGNQKAAYVIAAERGLDIVVLLHADGQYAPELLPEMVGPLVRGECEAVFGSRMMVRGAAREGGMPLYKWVGNRILTGVGNRVLGTDLTEFHSGYRAYSMRALTGLPLEANSDDFDFDTQIIIQLVDAGMRIREIPIPTYYGDEICYVNGLGYAKDVLRDVFEYKLSTKGFGTAPWVPTPLEHSHKGDDGSSHSAVLDMVGQSGRLDVLDLGCSGGELAHAIRCAGHHVTGVDVVEVADVRERVDRFVRSDLAQGLPLDELAGEYDLIVAADVIEHLPRPLQTLKEARGLLRPGGQLLLSVPNFAHWYPRIRVLLGAFGYDRRGILDDTHLRFFTRRTLRRTVRRAGFDILEERCTGLPLGVLSESSSARLKGAHALDELLVRLRPQLFAYQYVLRLTPHAESQLKVEVF